MPAPSHFAPTPPALTDYERDLARWEDDGGPVHLPRPEDDHWLRIAAALGQRLPEIAGRDDVIVTCRPGTRSGAPAAFFPDTAELEMDARLFAPVKPATIDPTRVGDEARYPAAWGAFTHEAAHAAHSRWRVPVASRGTALDEAAQILEESRVERAQISRRSDDRGFLRACIRTVVMPDLISDTPTDTWQAATAAGLILARRDAGILDPDEVQPLEHTLTGILGPDLLNTLAQIWTAAHTTGDEDAQTMMEHAAAWCEALNTDPTTPPPQSDAAAPKGELADVIGKIVSTIEANEAAQAAVEARIASARAARTQERATQAARARQAAQTAEKVFKPGARPFVPEHQRGHTRGYDRYSPVTGTRAPTPAEKAAAGRLARALRAASYRERTVTVTASAAPPGRLNMRGALARDAQKAAGAVPTAQPWIRTQRRQGPTPPLRVGIAVDISGSMQAAAGPIASAAWIVAKAAALTDPYSRSATIAYRRTLTAITAPGRTPARVTELDVHGGGFSLAETLDALTAGLDLTNPGAGRLVVIASDGHCKRDAAMSATERIAALRAAGCAVLWLAFDEYSVPLPGATFLPLTDPAQAAVEIGKAATAALAATP
ncbi:VWA domain-containing protein [Streptomyces acidiscabies]|uniref:VWA domain-containing protein n=1 Tax=Streptomyces acidiscabies TaxID=42234 RepID=UPI0038F71CA7